MDGKNHIFRLWQCSTSNTAVPQESLSESINENRLVIKSYRVYGLEAAERNKFEGIVLM